jgi:RNA polymerase sigma factor (sigma-70 family)
MTAQSMERWIHHLRRTALLSDGGGLSDGQLLQCFVLERQSAAFEALLRRHGSMVLGVCRRILRHAQDAEDAFQATWLVFVRKAHSISPPDMVANWLYGVAYRTALKAKAATARRWTKERQVKEMAPRDVESEGMWQDLQPLLDQELNRLPDKYRLPIVLCDLEGKTRKEAARQLGWPEGTLSGRLSRARVMLAKRISRRGVALSGGALAAALSQNVASAQLPSSLVVSTIKAATFIAAGHATAAAGMISAKVASLTEGVLKTMLLTKLKIVTAVLLGGIVLGTGITKAGYWGAADQGIASENLRSKHEKSGIAPAKPRAAKDKNDLESKLNLTISVDFKDTSLRQVLDDLRVWCGINIVVDWPALEERAISLDRRITMKLDGVSVKDALTLLLHQAQLDYSVNDNILTVTPLRPKLTLKIYKVGDLVSEGEKVEDTLIRIITHVVDPTSWETMGGPGTIDYWPLGKAFTINQTPEIHERLEALLDGLREMKNQEEDTKKKMAAQQAEKKPK